MPRIRFIVLTFAGICVAVASLFLARTLQIRRMADSVRGRAESLAAERRFSDAGAYFLRYLQLCPDDAAARIRLAEVFDLSATNPRRAVELYQSALGTAENVASAEKKLEIRTRLVELLLEGSVFQAAENEAEKLAKLERDPALQRPPAQWRAPGLIALATYGQYRAKSSVLASVVDAAFRRVLEPQAGEPHVYKDPRVYLARYEYRSQQRLPTASDDLLAAIEAAPRNVDVLLTAAVSTHQKAVAAKAVDGLNAKTNGLLTDAAGYYNRAIESAPSDPRAYLGLGQLLVEKGERQRAIETWQAGLKQTGRRDVPLHLSLADILIQENRLGEAEDTLQSLERASDKLRSQAKFTLQPLIDLRRGHIALRKGEYAKAISLVTELAGDKGVAGQSGVGQRAAYQAWLVLGAANAGLKHWDQSLAAYEQAISLTPQDLSPRLAAAAICAETRRYRAGIRYCQQALTAANAAKHPPIAERQLLYQQLIVFLEHESRHGEAERYRQLRMADVAASSQLTARWAEEAVWNGKLDEAVAVAQSGVKSRPHDFAAFLMLASAWWAKGDLDKATEAFQEAARVAPRNVRPLGAFFRFCVETGNSSDAQATLEKISQADGLTELERSAVLADGYVRLGDLRSAREAYAKAITAAGNDPAIQTRLAESLMRINDAECGKEGESLLRGIMHRYPPARRRLAEWLMARGTLPAWEEGRRLLEDTTEDDSTENRLGLALALTRRGGKENLARASTLCEQVLSEGKKPSAVAELLLAQLEHLQGDTAKARRRYRVIADRTPPSAASIAVYVSLLIEQGPADEAEQRLKQLEGLAPDELAVLGLRVRWLQTRDRNADIESVMEKWAARVLPQVDARQRLQLCEGIGDLYRRIGQHASAERWYRRVMRLAPSRFELVAMTVSAQGRTGEALTLCEQAADRDGSSRPAICMCKILFSGRTSPELLDRCQPSLAIALARYPNDVELLTSVAGVRILQGRNEEAIQICREILRRQPESFTALNNLAALLSESSKPARQREARECVDRAIRLFGRRAELLDTKGMILLSEEKASEAAGLFSEAASISPADPRCYFHLAIAYSKLGKLDRARTALKQASQAKLDRQLLTHLDRSRLEQLEVALR